MEGEKVVVDASVVAKWFLIEKYSEYALKLRDAFIGGLVQLVAPSILEYEVLNALKYSRVYTAEELRDVGKALNKYGFEIHELEGELKARAVEISARYDVTVYDASYVALAEVLGTRLYTADTELVRKFPQVVTHIADYR